MIIRWRPRTLGELAQKSLGHAEGVVERLAQSDSDVAILYQALLERLSNNPDDLADELDQALLLAADAIARAQSPDDSVDISTDSLAVALAVRGILRALGYHAKIRMLPEGGTRREHLNRARDRLNTLISYAFWD